MIRIGRGRSRATLELTPDVLSPTERLTALVMLTEPLDRLAAAKVELGYVNTYSYRWAGRRDAALRYDEDLLGPSQPSEGGTARTTKDWVAVLEHELPVAGGALAVGPHEVDVRIPSWAPGSSSIVRWVVRLRAERDGRPDLEVEQTCRVLTPPPPAGEGEPPPPPQLEVISGDDCDVVVDTERRWVRAGEQLRGTVTLTPRSELPEADVLVSLQRVRTSHPLERAPDYATEHTAARVQLDKRLRLPTGESTSVPFALDVPADADPTSEAVHSSLHWNVLARVMYKGFSHGIDRVRRELVVVTG
jgi:hypothetical protein